MVTTDRRTFLASTSAAAGALAVPAWARPRTPRRNDELRVALVGCGGRGAGAARDCLAADPNVRLVAMADAFPDRIQRAMAGFEEIPEELLARIDVPAERRFAGFDAYKKAVDCDVDIVILATPPHFRPEHLGNIATKGRHVFVEKPVAVDGQGVRRVHAASKALTEKGFSVVSGLCYRYHEGRVAVMERIHQGAIGRIVAMEANYITNGLWHHERKPGMSDMEFQVRNWLYWTWLSGDHITEQHVHSLDVMAWAKNDEYPVECLSMGGRIQRTDPKCGNIYDHFATRYTWADGTVGHSACRQQNGCVRDVSDHIRGADGHGVIFENRIDGANPYQHPGDKWELFSAMYRNEHKAMVAAIRAGQVIDNSHYMCGSTLMAVMGRMSAYTGKKVTWQEAWDSKEVLMPDAYVWGEAPESVVAVPGRYRLPVPPEPEVPDEQEAGTEGAGTTDASGGGAQGTGGAGTGGSGSGR